MFPSPYGDYGSYQHVTHYIVEGGPFDVSVPLRGLWFLSGQLVGYSKLIHQFPSPYGDYGSYPSVISTYSSMCAIGFRPLTGIMVLISYLLRIFRLSFENVSGPLRGLWFLSAPLINGFIAPSKMPFAGRIFFSPHFSHFCGK